MLTNYERSSKRIQIKIFLLIKMNSPSASSSPRTPKRKSAEQTIKKILMNNKEENIREHTKVRSSILRKLKKSYLDLKIDLGEINKKNGNAIRRYNSRKMAATFSPIKLNKNDRIETIISEKKDIENRIKIHDLIIRTFDKQLNTPNKISLRRLKALNRYTNMDNFLREFKKEYNKY